MHRVIQRAQWFTSGVLALALSMGYYLYGLPFISKVKFQWWVWTTEWQDLLKFNF